MSYGQTVRPCGPPQRDDSSSSTLLKGAAAVPKSASSMGEWDFIPSICVSERFDSNVLFVSGGSNHDYVTHVAPKVVVKHSGQYVSGTIEATGFNETYVKNPGFNFVGGGGSLSLDFDKTIKRLLPYASFRVSESIRYTPLPPGFLNPVAGTSLSDSSNPRDAFALGQLAYRANNLSNSVGAIFSYTISPMVSVNLGYSNAITRYGSSPLKETITTPLFDITTHSGTVGGAARVTVSDSLTVRYSYTDSTFNSVTNVISGTTVKSGLGQSFQSHSALLGWSKEWTPYFKSVLGGGGIVINPGLISWAMNAEVLFVHPIYPVTLSYARTAAPSILQQATPVIGNTVLLSASQRLSRDWQLAERVGFNKSTGATSDTHSGSNRLQFTSYHAGIDLYYWVTRVWSVAWGYDYTRFTTESGGLSSQFDRHLVALGVKATWE